MPNSKKQKLPNPKEPGDIVAYRRPRHDGEILCHNHVAHARTTPNGERGFRWFCCLRGGGWQVCPCGWRPEWGVHYANPEYVTFIRETLNRLGSPEALDRWLTKLVKNINSDQIETE